MRCMRFMFLALLLSASSLAFTQNNPIPFSGTARYISVSSEGLHIQGNGFTLDGNTGDAPFAMWCLQGSYCGSQKGFSITVPDVYPFYAKTCWQGTCVDNATANTGVTEGNLVFSAPRFFVPANLPDGGWTLKVPCTFTGTLKGTDFYNVLFEVNLQGTGMMTINGLSVGQQVVVIPSVDVDFRGLAR